MPFGARQLEYGGPTYNVRAQLDPGIGIPGMLPGGEKHGYIRLQDLIGYYQAN